MSADVTSTNIYNAALLQGNINNFKLEIRKIRKEESREILFQICTTTIFKDENVRCRFANALLAKYNAFENSKSEIQRYPLHECAKLGKYELLSTLLNHPKLHPADVQELNGKSKTAVHCAVEGAASLNTSQQDLNRKKKEINALKCIEILYDKNCYLDARDSQGFTAVHVAAKNGLWQLVSYFLLRNVNIDISTEEFNENARKLIQDLHPRWVKSYAMCNIPLRISDNTISFDSIAKEASTVQFEEVDSFSADNFFKQFLADLQQKEPVNWENYFIKNEKFVKNLKDKLLVLSIKEDVECAARILLEKYQADPKSSLFTAVEVGDKKYLKLVKLYTDKLEDDQKIDLISQKSANDNQTALHKAVTCKRTSAENVKFLMDFAKDLLEDDFSKWLNSKDNKPIGHTAGSLSKEDTGNQQEESCRDGTRIVTDEEPEEQGYTALQYAVHDEKQSDVVQILLQYGANIFIQDSQSNICTFNCIRYELLKKHFDDQIKVTDDKLWFEKDYSITLDFKILKSNENFPKELPERVPCFQAAQQDNARSADEIEMGEREKNSLIENGAGTSDSTSFNNQKNKRTAAENHSHFPKNNFSLEMEPLNMIADSGTHKMLLLHPLIKIFFHLKWNRLYWFYWANFLLFSSFAISFAVFVIYSNFEKQTNMTLDNQENLNDKLISKNAVWLTFVLNIGIFFREAFQACFLPGYFSKLENYIEMTIIIMTCFLPFVEQKILMVTILSLLISFEFMHLMGRHPRLAIYYQMLSVVAWNSLKLLLYYSPLIITFGFLFYIIFPACVGKECKGITFNTWLESMFKAMVMISGEYEAGENNFEFAPIASHMLFILFLFFVSIVMINLLNSVAVSDIQMMREKAELIFYKYQATFCSEIEITLFAWSKLEFAKTILSYTCHKINILDGLIGVKIYPNDYNRVEIIRRKSSENDCCFCNWCKRQFMSDKIFKFLYSSFHKTAAEAKDIAQLNCAKDIIDDFQELQGTTHVHKDKKSEY
ncbi:uncharacterized protein LOC132200853 [Neocloeon triangulifer]|uniref:uncharacterized protein LOC132200853 n=1 Tax=Neocloeon triangulifer TaxID=2078957 RepID=UPI00286FAE3C|nr:uncharacterized protein LOC132200853 [Neocloeon triangulifer]